MYRGYFTLYRHRNLPYEVSIMHTCVCNKTYMCNRLNTHICNKTYKCYRLDTLLCNNTTCS